MRINGMYFSATGTTEKVVRELVNNLANQGSHEKGRIIDFTLPDNRETAVIYGEEDLVVVGVPVYAGRVPNILLKYLSSIKGNGGLGIAVVVYGNRNYDDALIELADLLKQNGFKVISAGAFIGEHSFSDVLAKGRPDEEDFLKLKGFSEKLKEKLSMSEIGECTNIIGNRPYRPYYRPLNKDGISVDIRKVTPKTTDSCNDCKLCVGVCPMGSIDREDVTQLNGICIKCGACIKKCPMNAKYYDDGDYLRHKLELELDFSERKEPVLFL